MMNDNVKCTQSVLVKVQDLKKYFDVSPSLLTRVVERKPRALLKAVDGVSFEIRRGETLALVGESGCGKSTTARMLVGLDKPTSGTVEVDGKDLFASRGKDEKLVRGKIQMIFQDPYASLNPRWKVGRIVAEPIISQKVIKDPKEIENRVNSVLHLVNLSKEDKDKYPHQFSGGQRQRIGIARALAVRPQLIIADEPVSALDVSIQSQVLNLMSKLKKEYHLTYIFIAHDLSVVEHISDRIGVMYLGNFVEEANKENLYKNPMHPYTQALLSAVPIPDPTVKKERIILEGSIPSAINPPSGCKFHTRCPKCMEICKKEAPKKYQVGEDHFVYCHLYDKENPNVK